MVTRVSALAVVIAALLAFSPPAGAKRPTNKYQAYIHAWTLRDQSIHQSIEAAAFIFKVNAGWLHTCNGSEGGSVSPDRLRHSLRKGTQPGWNLSGSYAFGAMQFMLDRKPAPRRGDWGTYEKYSPVAFAIAKDRGFWVPARFDTPSSNVGQAITAAFMFAAGMSGQWSGAGC